MPEITWRGLRAPAGVAAALRDGKFQIATTSVSSAAPAVMFTASARRIPQPDGRAAWIWLCRDAVPHAAMLQAVRRGAYAVVSLRAPEATRELVDRLRDLTTDEVAIPSAPHLVTLSEVSRATIAKVARLAPTSMPVLLTGETGTGKEVVARLIHAWSPRQKKSFVPINCAAIPNELMEAELFGYARGAFSGAVQRYDGQLMAAEGGTVLLDEIDDTPLETQVKLLRVLEDRVVSRLGENVWREVDFRLLAATNRDLPTLVEAGLFGADLYERLAIVTIQLAPLRERLEDLPVLARHFMTRFANEQRRPALTDLRPEALRALSAYGWPGNIRELRNVIYETLVYKRGGSEILLSDLPKRILKRGSEQKREGSVDRSVVARKVAGGTMNLREEIAGLERVAIEEALRRTGGNAAQAARLLGELGRGAARDPGSTLRAMMRRLGR